MPAPRCARSDETPRRVFVALGRNELAPFIDAPQHSYLIRSVDPVDPPLPLPHAAYVTARGPFNEADDRALMTEHGIEVVIAKNSGGTRPTARSPRRARSASMSFCCAGRPRRRRRAVETIEDAIAWLDHALTSAAARGV